MTTGIPVEAEALIWGPDKTGNSISSGRFIHNPESSSDIPNLDPYILNRTLAQMDRRQYQQYELPAPLQRHGPVPAVWRSVCAG